MGFVVAEITCEVLSLVWHSVNGRCCHYLSAEELHYLSADLGCNLQVEIRGFPPLYLHSIKTLVHSATYNFISGRRTSNSLHIQGQRQTLEGWVLGSPQ